MKLNFVGIASLLTTLPLINAIPSDGTSSDIFQGVKWMNPPTSSFKKTDDHRNLQDLTIIPPARSCGEIINIATVDQIKQVAAIVVSALLGDDNAAAASFALSTVEALITHDVQAQVVCASCNEVRTLAPSSTGSGLDDLESTFETYCGEDRFAADTNYSSLLLIPFDPVTGTPKEGTLKPHLVAKSFSTISQHAPTEFWTQDFNAWNTTDFEAIGALYSVFYDGWSPLMIAAAGVVVVAPDYSGFGQTGGTSPKLPGYIGMYQQAFSVAYLKSQQIVESTGCTVLSNKFSASGYSEGGFASMVGANTLVGLGMTPLNVDTGAAPFNATFQFAYVVRSLDNGTYAEGVRNQLVYGAASFSSKTPDLPNSNVGQNALSDEWVESLNEATNSDLSFFELGAFLPDPVTDAFHPEFLEHTRMTISEGIIDSCVTTTEGVDDLLCQALQESSLLSLVQDTEFPISICHSPDDTTIPSSGHAPDVSLNPLLSERAIFGLTPSGSHGLASAFCHFGFVVQFTLDSELRSAEPLEDPSTCSSTTLETTVAPVSVAPVTMIPIGVTQAPVMLEDSETTVTAAPGGAATPQSLTTKSPVAAPTPSSAMAPRTISALVPLVLLYVML